MMGMVMVIYGDGADGGSHIMWPHCCWFSSITQEPIQYQIYMSAESIACMIILIGAYI